jgi:hypothetical protein
MNRAFEWLRITWPVLLVAALLIGGGLVLIAAGSVVGVLIGICLIAFAAYWLTRGLTPSDA